MDGWILVLLTILFAVGVVLSNPAVSFVAALTAVALVLARLWDRYCLVRVEYERVLSEDHAFMGETVDLMVRVSNRKILPLLWLETEDIVPLDLPIEGVKLELSPVLNTGILQHLLSLRWYERVSWHYRVHCQQRGLYVLGPVTLRSSDIFGLRTRERRIEEKQKLVVYPRVVPIANLGIPAYYPFGEGKARHSIFEDPSRTVGVRDYRPEDGLRRVHWPATARRQALQVRVYEPTTAPRLLICLDIRTMPHSWMGQDPERLEQVISLAASIASDAVERRFAVGLYANGVYPDADQAIRIPPGRDLAQISVILEALAKISPITTCSLADLLHAETSSLPWGTSLVLIAALASDDLRGAVLRLKDAGHRLSLITLDSATPPQLVPGVPVYQVRGEAIDLRRFVDFEGTQLARAIP
ncbi:MAG: DUF58 domain-containing protein [Chloroflexi bacterium]|nr:DUF58 domain-containing protein [Chloroflexota bacterium]MBU1749354.1 DUF58 domain-containing protein [Chloroflexota bacterium]